MEVVESEFVSSSGAWKLQSLTNLNSLPDYQPLDAAGREIDPGAPVTTDGKPLFFPIPHGFLAAQNDGERWRYCLKEAREYDRSLRDEVFYQTAGFFHAQFGVQTLAFYGPAFGRLLDSRTKGIDGNVLELDTLSEEETVARLAVGVERFRMQEATNFIKLYAQTVKRAQPYYGAKALVQLAEIFENRRQYARAAEFWRTLIDRHDGDVTAWERRLAQIVAPWGCFEPTMSQPAGKPAEVHFRFRNGHSLRCEAYEIDVAALLADVESYLKSKPEEVDFARTDIADIGYRLLADREAKYLGKKVASWSAEIRPRSGHFDKTLALKTPLTRPGAYLMKSSMAGGNTSAIVVWIADTALVQKPLESGQFFFVADVAAGNPVPDATVRFFGWRRTSTDNQEYVVETAEFSAKTDERGQVVVPNEKLPESYRWVVTATTQKGRFALLGWETFTPAAGEPVYNEIKAFLMTDRPVYRPEETVRYKFWIRRASYASGENAPARSEFAGKRFEILVADPEGEEVAKTELTADEFGGVEGSLNLPADVSAGTFHVSVRPAADSEPVGQGTFPVAAEDGAEFEVALDTPSEPVKLGKPFRFSVAATYRGGAPVSPGTVDYTVYRRRRGRFYPPRQWDWLYGRGYWWLQDAVPWLPGWDNWGRVSPEDASGNADSAFGRTAPELVAKSRAVLGEEGTVSVELQTALTAALHPNEDQEYVIEARVTDPMRKTVVARSEVLVARQPLEAIVWIDRGFAASGEEIGVSVLTTSAAGVPSSRKGRLSLYRVRYDAAGNPSEELFDGWDTQTDAVGAAKRTIVAEAPGQYRLVFVFDDEVNGPVIGGCLFTVTGETAPANYRFGPLSIVPDRAVYRPGEKVKLLVSAARPGSTVLLFVRPEEGVYERPRVITMKDRTSDEVVLEIDAADVPDFFVEGVVISDGTPHECLRRIIVPPSNRVLEVTLAPSATRYQPGEKATLGVTLRGENGKPIEGTAVVAVFEKALEAVAGAAVEDVRAFFWDWTRKHAVRGTSNLEWVFYNLVPPDAARMENLGVFGDSTPRAAGLESDATDERSPETTADAAFPEGFAPSEGGFWFDTIRTGADGQASIDFTVPEVTTRWEIASWGLAAGTRVGQAQSTILVRKDFVVSLQVPDYLVGGDQCALSALLRNYQNQEREVRLQLSIDGDAVAMRGSAATRSSAVPPDKPADVSWTVDAHRPGDALLKVSAETDGKPDVIEKPLHVLADGLALIAAEGGFVGPGDSEKSVILHVPEKRREDETTFTVRLSTSLGGAAADAIPFLYDAPFAGTGQTLDRFLPAVALQRALQARGADIRPAKEDDAAPAKRGLRLDQGTPKEGNPVFSMEAVSEAARKGMADLAGMQLDDGGWGWFFGWGAQSNPLDTATVVRGLSCAKRYGLEPDAERIARGVEWLKRYEEEQIKQIKNFGYTPHRQPWKPGADNTDALVFAALTEQGEHSEEMTEFLYRDRKNLTPYGLALYCHALAGLKDKDRLSGTIRSLWASLRTDEGKTEVWLETPKVPEVPKTPNPDLDQRANRWYGNHMATQAAFLRLLVRIDPGNELLPKVARYIITHRANGTYWNSTYDTALCTEALAEYIGKVKGPEPADTKAQIWISGKLRTTATIPAKDRFEPHDVWTLEGRTVPNDRLGLKVIRTDGGPVCFSGILKTFTPRDALKPSGEAVKIERTYYVLEPIGGNEGQTSRIRRYQRRPFSATTNLVVGSLIEVELAVESRFTLDKMVLTDYRPAGFKPVEVREGYTKNDLEAYVEYRDDSTVFFAPRLSEGSRYVVTYRMEARTAGTFTALPATLTSLHAPNIKANSDAVRVQVLK